jgi:D-glycero-alpha-D-manno-heptose 1-phosphate guanylyltransferase
VQAIVLAGGMGTRLRSVVADRPKVMAEIAGRPFLEHLLGRLSGQGVNRVVLAVGYLREMICSHFGSNFSGLRIDYSVEDSPLGTGGAVRQALLVAERAPCFVLNGDTWLDIDLAGMLDAHQTNASCVSMAVRALEDVGRFGALEVRNGRVVDFVEKGRQGPGYINAGLYLMSPEVFDSYDLPVHFSNETDFLMPQVARLHPLAFECSGDFIDIGLPADYQRALAMFARHG